MFNIFLIKCFKDTIHVVTSNPVCMYVMKGIDNKCSRLTLNHFFDTRRQNLIPRIRLASLSGRFENIVALHEEVSNTLLLVDPTTGTVLRLGSSNLLDTVKEFKDRLTGAGQSAANLYRLKTGWTLVIIDLSVCNLFIDNGLSLLSRNCVIWYASTSRKLHFHLSFLDCCNAVQ